MKNKQLLKIILFVIAAVMSVCIPYFLMSTQSPSIVFFGSFYVKFILIIVPILVAWLGLLLAKGKWLEILKHSRELIIFTAIFLVMTFSIFKWTNVVNSYGLYGHPIKNALKFEEFQRDTLLSKMTPYEQETIYREMLKEIVAIELNKIWFFSGFVFLSTFLLLLVIPKNKIDL